MTATLTQRQTITRVLRTEKQSVLDDRQTPNEMPIKGVARLVPLSWVPYVQLMRLDRAGFFGFFMPTLVGLTAGACLSQPRPSPEILLHQLFIFYVATHFIRGTACTWNDNVDQDFDRQVPRTCCRPIARGAVSTTQAHIFTIAQLAITAWILSYNPPECLPWNIALFVLHTIYPLCKRFMGFTPVFLGLPFATTMMVSAVALGLEPSSLPAICLFGVEFLWTVIFETIYAHQDVEYDLQAGVKSMAVRFKHSTKTLATFLAIFVVGLMVTIGIICELSTVYFAIGCGGTAFSLATIIRSVDLTKPESCAYWFRTGFYIVGGSKAAGFLAHYLVHWMAWGQ